MQDVAGHSSTPRSMTYFLPPHRPIVQAYEEFDEEVQDDIPAHRTTPNSLTSQAYEEFDEVHTLCSAAGRG